MMRPSNHLAEVFICLHPVDFRKGINGLSILVEAELERDPFSERLFVFRNRGRDKVKILFWERNGFCMWQKRLEKDRFQWPQLGSEKVSVITGQQLNWLLDGYDISAMKGHEELKYSSII